jgi:hypothetical protein
MGRVVYEVPLVTQGQNPICWVPCMAMVESERMGYSIGVGKYTNGFDPSISCMPELSSDSNDWEGQYRKLASFGFGTTALSPDANQVESFLRDHGPFILLHMTNGFPYNYYGAPPITSGMATHAVVITGIDSRLGTGLGWFNNPWGEKDRPITTLSIITAMSKMQSFGIRPVAYYMRRRN